MMTHSLLLASVFHFFIASLIAHGQTSIPSSGDPLIDNLRAVEAQIQEFNADRQFAERWNLERKVEMRYGRQIAKGLEQASATLLNRIQNINSEFAKFGRTLESTEPLRDAAARYRAYSRMMKFSGEPNTSFIQIEELPSNLTTQQQSPRIRLTKNGRALVELTPEAFEFIKKSEILGPVQIKSNSSGNYIREYDVIQPRSHSYAEIPGRIDLKTYEPDKELSNAAR